MVMKELSIEEKAKRYDEVFEIAKEIHNEHKAQCADVMTKIFPELKESEDERIRRRLSECLNNMWLLGNNMDYSEYGKEEVESWIAWLEQQGDKVSAIEGFETEFERQVSHLIASAINREHEYNEGYVKWTANALLNFAKYELEKQGEKKSTNIIPKFKIGDKIIEKDFDECGCGTIIDIKDGKYIFDDGEFICIEEQGLWKLVEQKPAWSEEDDNCLSTIIAEFSKCAGKSVSKDEWMRCNDFLNSLKDRVLPQPKQEWSEGDEATKNNISHIIRQYDKISKRENKPCWYIGDCLLWMQNIKDRVLPQLKQEWGEEDRAMLDCVITILCENDKYEENKCQVEWLKGIKDKAFPELRQSECSIDKAIKWLEDTFYEGSVQGEDCEIVTHDFYSMEEMLESFRYAVPQKQWKPSEEQIEALGCAKEYLSSDRRKYADSLYNDLKAIFRT